MANSLLAACLREVKRILSDSRIYPLLIGGPFFYAFVFGGAFWQGRVQHVPIVIVDQDHSAMSREFVRALSASDSVQIVGWANSPSELQSLVRRQEAYACVAFPLNFERDVLAGRSPKVAVLLDGSNALSGGPPLSAVREVAGTFQVGIDRRELEASGVPADGSPTITGNSTAGNSTIVARPITYAERPLFNPTGSYSYFILIGLVCAAAQGVIRMGVGVSLGHDRSDQLRSDLSSHNLSTPWLFASKVIGTSFIALPAMYGATACVLWLFGTPHRGSLFLVFAACTIYVPIQICMGYAYFGLCKSPLFALHIHMYMASALFILSGFTWPYYAMPPAVSAVAHCIPLFPMNCIMRKINLIGAPASSLIPHFLALAIWLFVASALGYIAFKQWCKTENVAPIPKSGM
jgi:ABC-2 type transport system permease protein